MQIATASPAIISQDVELDRCRRSKVSKSLLGLTVRLRGQISNDQGSITDSCSSEGRRTALVMVTLVPLEVFRWQILVVNVSSIGIAVYEILISTKTSSHQQINLATLISFKKGYERDN